jgi:hypothetical protein
VGMLTLTSVVAPAPCLNWIAEAIVAAVAPTQPGLRLTVKRMVGLPLVNVRLPDGGETVR